MSSLAAKNLHFLTGDFLHFITGADSHVTASMVAGVDVETLKRLRNKCVKDVKNTIGNIRYDKIYAHQHPLFEDELEVSTDEI